MIASFPKVFRRNTLLAGAIFTTLALLAACTLKKPDVITPVPSEQVFSKEFFVNEDGSLRKFLFGVAAESIAGHYGPHLTNYNYNSASHSNVVFDPYASEHWLIGRELNPSRMGAGHLKAEDMKFLREVIRIPITKRFYLEKAKDQRGRETSEMIENDTRSHWSARPHMKLNLSCIQILDRHYAMFGYSTPRYSIGSVSHIEKSEDGKKFLGYSVMADAQGYSGSAQARFRINFLEFETKSPADFPVVPYNEQNSKYVNTLHVIGKMTNGTSQILSAAHWDVNKGPIKIRLNDFPDEFIDIGKDVINEWNIAFTQALKPEIKNPRKNFHKFFESEVTQAEHAFDLRHPTITWVSDKEISAYGPLGVGMAHADVTNGEILWGGVTIYGGMIESYVRRNIPNEQSFGDSESMILSNLQLPLNENLKKVLSFDTLHENFVNIHGPSFDVNESSALSLFNKKIPSVEMEENKAYYQRMSEHLGSESSGEMDKFISRSQAEAALHSYTTVLGAPFQQFEAHNYIGEKGFMSDVKDKLLGRQAGVALDSDLRLADKADGWRTAIQANGRDYGEALRSIVKYLLLHEVGHMLGHGHQFKENIVPEKGSVPDKYIYGDPHAELDIQKDGLLKRSTEEEHYTNYSSVMGYLDPRSEVMIDYNDFVVGPHDILLTRYLYKGEYPVYKEGEEDFKFEKVTVNGEIPAYSPKDSSYKTAFFPACNDLDVILSGDPFCDRFVRGSSPDDIRKSYISRLYDGLATRLISFKPGGEGHGRWSEYHLWSLSLKTMGRLRMFYDHMRQAYDADFKKLAEDEDNLYRFYNACTDDGPSNATLDNLFSEKPKLKELCKTFADILGDIKNLVGINAVDHTRYIRENRYSPSGMTGGDIRGRDLSQYTGSWVELSAFPIKMSALYNMTSTSPYVPTWFGLYPIERFSDAYSHYSVASFYPVEYSEILTEALMKNLQFSNGADDLRTKVGRLVFSIGIFDYLNKITNDSLFIPDTVNNRLEKQTSISISTSMIYLKEHFKENSTSKVTHFSASIFDFQSKEVEDLTGGIYLLPDKKYIAKAPHGTFILPITEIRFFGQSKNDKGLAYSIVLKITYDPDNDWKYPSLRALDQLAEKERALYKQCVTGVNDQPNGLEHFFNSTFDGFEYSSNIGGQPTKQEKFFHSVETSFENYYSSSYWKSKKIPAPDEKVCTEAATGMGVIASSAAALNLIFLRPLFRRSEVDR